MPKALDECVSSVKSRGVSESSAFAICTISLRKSEKSADRDKEFTGWAKKVDLPASVHDGMRESFQDINSSDMPLIHAVKQVSTTSRSHVLGEARLSSRRLSVSAEALSSMGHPMWYAAVLLHEAIHAVHGMMEHEATHIEQRFAGNQFGVGKHHVDRSKMREALKVSAMAQGQRELDVIRRLRKNDMKFLVESGYTPKVARKVLTMGINISKKMRENRTVGKSSKQFVYAWDDDKINWVEKVITEEMSRLLIGAASTEWVEKTCGGDASVYTTEANAYLDGSEQHKEAFEDCVRLSIDRGIGADLRAPKGIVPVIRRAGHVAKLEDSSSAIRELIADASKEGLYIDGEPTDSHILLVMHGFSPVLDKF